MSAIFPQPATPPTLDQLKEAIDLRIRGVHEATPDVEIDLENTDLFSDSYTKCIEAMRDAAVMAFNHVAAELGVTGFQASVAALHAYAMEMGIESPFMFIRLEDALYPQYDLPERVQEWISREDNRQWLTEQAEQKLREHSLDGNAHPAVEAHWKAIVKGAWPPPAV